MNISTGSLKSSAYLPAVIRICAFNPVRVPAQHSHQGIRLLDRQGVPQENYSPALEALFLDTRKMGRWAKHRWNNHIGVHAPDVNKHGEFTNPSRSAVSASERIARKDRGQSKANETQTATVAKRHTRRQTATDTNRSTTTNKQTRTHISYMCPALYCCRGKAVFSMHRQKQEDTCMHFSRSIIIRHVEKASTSHPCCNKRGRRARQTQDVRGRRSGMLGLLTERIRSG